MHYHIRWSDSKLDWEAFKTEEEAEERARELAFPDEGFAVERFNGDCPRCSKGLNPQA